MGIGDRLRLKRKELDMTLEDVAAFVGVNRQTMSRYETGTIKNIPSDKIELLAKALHATPGYIMGWEGQLLSEIADEASSGRTAVLEEVFKAFGTDHRASIARVMGNKVAYLYYNVVDRTASDNFGALLQILDSLAPGSLAVILRLVRSYLQADQHTRTIIDTVLQPYYLKDYANEMQMLGAPDDEIEKAVEEYRQALIAEKKAGSQTSGASGSAAG